MAQKAAHLVDRVIPPVPVRQWVISVPKRLRGFLADRPQVVAALTRIFLGEIERLLCEAAGATCGDDALAAPPAAAEAPAPPADLKQARGVRPDHKLRPTVTALAIGNVGKRRDAATGGHATCRCCVSPAGGPPTDWGALVQVHDDRDVFHFQASPDELPVIDIHSL